jgi:hypothetical protein
MAAAAAVVHVAGLVDALPAAEGEAAVAGEAARSAAEVAVALATLVLQTVPQEPQLLASVCTLTHCPLQAR